MNLQKAPGGIEWTRIARPDGSVLPGYTWNPTAGCLHGCTWRMPDGSMTECYAKTVAEGIAAAAYPQGFAHHYWRPDKLEEPLRLREPAGIFVGSMADLFGHWVPREQIDRVLAVMAEAQWHTFQLLTKYPMRLREFRFPPNVWVGVSLPAGHRMPERGAERALGVYLQHMESIRATVRFLSIEPLWFDAGRILRRHRMGDGRFGLPIEWAIVGAATKRRKRYQPEHAHVNAVLRECDRHSIPVFFKGNLYWSPFREEFPQTGPR